MSAAIPKVNFLGLIAGILAIVSILFPWWGITTTFSGSTTSTMWGFFGGPGHLSDSYGAQNFSPTITTYSPIILGLVLLSAALAFIGSFTPGFKFLAAGLVTSIGAVVGYAELIGYATSNSCQGQGCITQPTGSMTFFGFNVNWGFQTGFYLFVAATILILVGIVFHQILTRSQTTTRAVESKTGFCPNCGKKLPASAKFCPSCAHPLKEGTP